jgi:hypothetical protein
MSLEGPQLRYARGAEKNALEALEEGALARALRLAREVEELLDEAPSTPGPSAHSTRIAHAMAASLIDELEALVRGAKKSGAA